MKDCDGQKFAKQEMPGEVTQKWKMDLGYVVGIYLFNFAQPKYKTINYIK